MACPVKKAFRECWDQKVQMELLEHQELKDHRDHLERLEMKEVLVLMENPDYEGKLEKLVRLVPKVKWAIQETQGSKEIEDEQVQGETSGFQVQRENEDFREKRVNKEILESLVTMGNVDRLD